MMHKKVMVQTFGVILILFVLYVPCGAEDFPSGYSMPLTGPQFGAPPITFSDTKMVAITFKTTPEILQKLVPRPLVPNPDNLMFVYFGRFNPQDYTSGEFVIKGISYLEVAFGVPAAFSNQLGGYMVYMYLDKASPTIFGRELWGYPKKDADITMIEEDGKITARVERRGTTLVKATFQRTEKVEPIPSRPPTVRYNLKFIPSVKKNAPPDVMQLTSTVIDYKAKELYKGNATLELGSSSVDPLDKIPILQIVRAEYVVMDGVLDYGDVLYDYLEKGKK
jgi:acetoacetate decarboxylase